MTNVVIINGEKFGLSPAEKDFTVTIFGKITSAILTVNFGTSLGYGLTGVIINGTKLEPKNDSLFTGDVTPLLKNGGNHLTVTFNAVQLFGVALGSAVISANIQIEGGAVVQLPSLSQEIKNIENWASAQKSTLIVLAVVGMIGAVSLAVISSRLPSFGGVKIKNLPVVSHINNAADLVKEKLS